MNYSTDQIDAQFAELPEKVQDYVLSDAVSDDIDQMVEAWGIEQEEDFRQYVLLLLIGLWEINDFKQIATTEFSLTEDEAQKLILDLDTLVLQEARDIMLAEADAVPPPPPQRKSAVIAPIPETIHSLDLEVLPQNLPMVETEEERHQLLKNMEREMTSHEDHTKPSAPVAHTTPAAPYVEPAPTPYQPIKSYHPAPKPIREPLVPTPSYNDARPEAPSLKDIPRLNLNRQTPPPPSFQDAILAPHFEKPDVPQMTPPPQPQITESGDKQLPKFSYHDKDPYREPPEA